MGHSNKRISEAKVYVGLKDAGQFIIRDVRFQPREIVCKSD